MPELIGVTVKTYRYLRLAMVAVLALLGAAVLIEHGHTHPRCFQPSISDYYYTPAQAVFVAALVAIGVCLVVLKGSTEWEDILLNLGGMFALVVGFVPTPQSSTCSSVPEAVPDIGANVANNIPALFVAGTLGLIVVVGVPLLDRSRRSATGLPQVLGVVVAVAVLAGGFGWFLADRSSFVSNAHYGAALPLFGCIIAVAVINARGLARRRTGVVATRQVTRNRYFVIAALMVATPVLLWLVSLVVSWEHVVLWIEAIELVLFATFWLIQTSELWHEGVRGAV